MGLTSINPYTGKVIKTYEALSLAQARTAVNQARAAARDWRATSLAARAGLFSRAAQVLKRGKEEYAVLITSEMGKPIRQARAEVEKCAWLFEHYAAAHQAPLADSPVPTEYTRSFAAFEPLGVLLGVMPWNFPFWQAFRFAAPALMAGNTVLLKHASNVPGSALALMDVFQKAGFPEHVFTTLLIGAETATKLIEQGLFDGVSLTGSVSAGRAVGRAAGSAIARLVLELGGSDPFIVLEDANLAEAARLGLASRMNNAGQTCIAAKRFIVAENVADEFEALFMAGLNQQRLGDPMDEATDIGPLARPGFVEEIRAQVDDAQARGAVVATGPAPPEGPGFFFAPVMVTGVKKGMRVLEEETFGPVAVMMRAGSGNEAVALANDSVFGLGAAVWTADTARGERLARRLEAGFVAVNDMVKSDPRLPFGGVKASGVGRELGEYGLREFVNVKAIVIRDKA